MVSKMAAAALAMAAVVGMSLAPVSQGFSYGYVVSNPAPQQQRAATTQAAARDEVERVAEAMAAPRTIYRQRWDGKSRSAGDRAHKRMKHRRASGRRA